MVVLGEESVKEALEMLIPGIISILDQQKTTWGPKFVYGSLSYPSTEGLNTITKFHFGDIDAPWNPEWGEKKDFPAVAESKRRLAARLKVATSEAVAMEPWNLQEGEFLWPGGFYRLGISVGISGAMGRTDEAIAEMVVSAIIMLARLETDKRIQEHKMRI